MEYLNVVLSPSEHTRLFNKINITGVGCWEWMGGRDQGGYGQGFYNYKHERVHRIIYAAFKGQIPRGKHVGQLDHLCRNRICCNPDHLELVSPRENKLRGTSPVAVNAQKKLCKYGHEFSIAPSGRRVCKTCDSNAKKKRKTGEKAEYWKQKAREATKRWYIKHKKIGG